MKLITALATPFKEGKVDVQSYTRLLSLQRGADGLLCCGTTGESALLEEKERRLLISLTRGASHSAKLWVGVDGISTQKAVQQAVNAQKQGADGLLVAPPAFFKCTKEGYCQHIAKIQDACQLPIMLYNAPGRCGYVLWEDAVKSLGKGCMLKDAGNDTEYSRRLAKKMPLYCGNEELFEESIKAGAVGVVSVLSNLFLDFVRDASQSMHDASQSESSRLFSLLAKATFCCLNPIPIKYMLYKAGVFDSDEVRLPLTAADQQTRNEIDNLLKNPKIKEILPRF